MNVHSMTAAVAVLALAAATSAQSQAPAAQTANAQPAAASTSATMGVPPNTCVAPVYPSKERTEHLKPEAYNKAVEAFNHDYKAYGECVKKYVEDTKQILKAVADAGNKAIEDYNKYNTDLHEQIEADKK